MPSICPICKWVFLTDSKFQPGALVRDNHARVGKVVGDPILVELDGNTVEVVTVDFWGQKVKSPENFLNLLASDSPEALLLEQPEALAPWADEAPLKLVALALSVGGGSGKAADIRAKLDGRVLEAGKWENWWKKQPQQMRKLPARFKITKVGRDSEYSLLTSFNAVPAASELKAVGGAEKEGTTPADWREWLLSPTHEPAPGRYPTKSVADSLAKWPAGTIEQALFRVIVSSEGLLSAGNLSGPVAEGWLRATAQAALRWRETAGPDAAGYTAARVGGVLARLSRIAGERTPQDLLLKAGAMDGEADAWRWGFAAGMWEAFDGEDARELYRRSAAALGRQARGDLAREMVLASFGSGLPGAATFRAGPAFGGPAGRGADAAFAGSDSFCDHSAEGRCARLYCEEPPLLGARKLWLAIGSHSVAHRQAERVGRPYIPRVGGRPGTAGDFRQGC